MRIAVLSYGLPVAGEKRGGIERVAHALADGLARRGHAVVVFSHDPKPPRAAYEVRELPWKAFVDTWLGRRVTMGYLGNILATRVDVDGFDAVIAHGDSLLLSLGRKPVLRVMHGSARGEAEHATSIGRALLQWGVYAQELLTALLASPHVVGVSANTQRDNRLVRQVIPLGVDTEVFGPLPVGKSPHPSIVFVGALEGRKRGGWLLDTFVQTVRARFPDAELMFVGAKGPSHPGVAYFTGVPDAELASMYRRAWVCASPSTYEGFGLPYLEAMACGTAVLATPNEGSREVLGHGYGGLVSDDDFASALVMLLGDESRRRVLESAGILRAAEFPMSRMIDAYETVLNNLREAHAGSVVSA